MGSVSSGLLRYAHCPVAIVHDEDPLMSHPSQAPVLVGVDGSSASELATAIAFDEASRRNVGLVALHAWSDADVSEWPGIDQATTESIAEEVSLTRGRRALSIRGGGRADVQEARLAALADRPRRH